MIDPDRQQAEKLGIELALSWGPRVRSALKALNALMAEALNTGDLLALSFVIEAVSGVLNEAVVLGRQAQERQAAGPTDVLQ